MKIVAGTAGTPAEPYEQCWGTILIFDNFNKEICTKMGSTQQKGEAMC